MIKRLAIRNYRSIESVELHPRQLCALVGENNAGKSNILRALRTVLSKDWLTVRDFRSDDFHRHDATNDIVIEIEFDPPLVHEGFVAEDPTPVPILRYTLTRYKRTTKSARAGDLRLNQECLSAELRPISVLQEAPKKGVQRKFKPLAAIPADIKDQVPLVFVGADRRLNDQLPSARYSVLRRLLEDVAGAVERRTVEDGDGSIVPVRQRFEALLSSALSVLRIEEFIDLESLVQSHAAENLGYNRERDRDRFGLRFGLFDPTDFFKTLRLLVDEHGVAIDASELGDGAQSAIVVAIFQAYERLKKGGAIFIIEEPELHLHPHRAKYFYNTLRRLSATNQVFYSTHSPHFVTIPWFDEVRLVYRSEKGGTAINEPAVKITDQVRERLIKELDPERNELFFARHVILVEGDTEKLAIPEYARRLEIDLDREGVSIVEVGGKKSLDLFVRIVKALGLHLTVVFDADSSDFQGNRDKEAEYNNLLHDHAGAGVKVIMLQANYEEELRRHLGDAAYQRACQAYPKVSKAIRARLIALDDSFSVPGFIEQILAPWVAGEAVPELPSTSF